MSSALDVPIVSPILALLFGVISAICYMVSGTSQTGKLREISEGSGPISLAPAPVLAVQLTAVLIGAAINFGIGCISFYLAMGLAVIVLPIGHLVAHRVYKARRLPFIVVFPCLIGSGLQIGAPLGVLTAHWFG